MIPVFNFNHNVLSIDPSLNCSGYSVFLNGALREYGNIYFSSYVRKGEKKKTIGYKLYHIEKRLKEIIEVNEIDLIVMEKYRVLLSNAKNNMKINTSCETMKLLPMVRGIIRKVCFENNIECAEIWDGEVKKILTGSGRADKSEVQSAVNSIYGISLSTKKDEDISDSIGVGFSFFKLQELRLLYSDNISDAINFLNEYHNIKSKTQKSLISIGVDINKWKSLMK